MTNIARHWLRTGLLSAALLAGTGLGNPVSILAQTLTTRTYTTANGLMQSSVYCLGQDALGRLWIGSQAGVSLYNGLDFKNYGGAEGLTDSHVRAIAAAPDGPTVWLGQQYAGLAAFGADGRIHAVRVPGLRVPGHLSALWAGPGELWVGTETQGVWRLRYRAGRPDTLSQHWDSARGGLPTDSILQVGPGLRGRQWAASARGLLVFDAGTGQPLPAERAALPSALREELTTSFCRASDSVAWVGTQGGLLRLSAAGPGGWRVRRYTAADGLDSNNIYEVKLDAQGSLWVNTAQGLSQGTATTGALRFRTRLRRPSLYPDRNHALLTDREGSVWAATPAGLMQYLTDERFAQFTRADGLTDETVTALAQPRPDELWVGTHRGITVLPLGPLGPHLPARQLAVPTRNGQPVEVMCLLPDRQGGVWVGVYHDGARRYDPRTGRWQRFDQVPGLANVTVSSMAEDRRGRVWLATHLRGVSVYDPASGRFQTFQKGQRGLNSNNFWQICRDRHGRLWLASDDDGLLEVDTDHDTFRRVDGGAGRLSLGSVSEDPRGDLWLGPVGTALLRYEPATGRLHRYGPNTGLQSINPYFVQPDSAGRVWVGTHLGVDVLDPRTGRARSYGRTEGFGGGETNQNAVLLDNAGRLWMGTVGGLMLYDPHHRPRRHTPPPAFLTGVRVGVSDTLLPVGTRLPADLNSLSFEYAGVSLAQPGNVRYQYRLRGLSDEWGRPVQLSAATFANLPPGAYHFEVRAGSPETGWGRPARFAFSIAPPAWRTWWAGLLYAGVLGWAFYGVRRYTRHQERARAERGLERQALGHLQELDRVKTDFFTNISHELRTPLTLILGPAELLAEQAPDPTSRRRGGLVLNQARKLLTLINQLLDLSKLEAGALRLRPTRGDVAALASRVVAGFDGLAASRDVALRLVLPPGPVPLVFDAEKLDEVLTNLLANALRFTPAGGEVVLRVAELPPHAAMPAGSVELSVRDSGPGIAAADLPHVFNRFYQAAAPSEAGPAAPAGAAHQGTGIGLALVRELVARHGGTVEVSSLPGQGACFVVQLPRSLPMAEAVATGSPPITNAAEFAETFATDEAIETAEAATLTRAPDQPSQSETTGPGPGLSDAALGVALPAPADAEPALVLLIEDSSEMRDFIAETLAPAGYRLLLAADGAAGLALARAEVPDLIVSDVMMPGLSGYEVCAALKSDAATSHIPVVLLTARSGADDRLLGLETGAQAYLPKPFRPRELQAQVRSLLHLSQQGRARFAAPAPGAVPADALHATAPHQLAAHAAAVAALPSLDQAFLARFEAAVLARLGDETCGVDQLADALALSRTQLHRKLKALTGQVPGEYLRQARLHRALALLQARAGTVAEVAYQVGYGSPNHFSTAFSREFGFPPSAAGKAS